MVPSISAVEFWFGMSMYESSKFHVAVSKSMSVYINPSRLLNAPSSTIVVSTLFLTRIRSYVPATILSSAIGPMSLSITDTENLIVSPVPASDGEFCVHDRRS